MMQFFPNYKVWTMSPIESLNFFFFFFFFFGNNWSVKKCSSYLEEIQWEITETRRDCGKVSCCNPPSFCVVIFDTRDHALCRISFHLSNKLRVISILIPNVYHLLFASTFANVLGIILVSDCRNYVLQIKWFWCFEHSCFIILLSFITSFYHKRSTSG